MTDTSLGNALSVLWELGRLGDVSGSSLDGLRQALTGVNPASAADQIAQWISTKAAAANDVGVVATGLSWVGGGTRSVEQTLISMIAGASHEILVTAYSLTSGSSRVFDALAAAVSTGVRCVLVINRLEEQRPSARQSLHELRSRHPGLVRICSFSDAAAEGLHAKVVVVDRKVALVGSANLTFHGMTASHELGLLVRGPAAAAVGVAVDRLIQSPYMRTI